MAHRLVCLNIGHGGTGKSYDPGAIGADGTEEHVFNRDEFAPLLEKELARLGISTVRIIQGTYSGLPARINKENPALILSLHFNAYNGSATGSETLYWHSSKLGKKLATLIQNGTVKALKLADRGIKPKDSGDRGAKLLRDTNAPCVILEPFFGDNAGDLKTARERLPELARLVARAVESYFFKIINQT